MHLLFMPCVHDKSETLNGACSGDFNPIKKPLTKQGTAFQTQPQEKTSGVGTG